MYVCKHIPALINIPFSLPLSLSRSAHFYTSRNVVRSDEITTTLSLSLAHHITASMNVLQCVAVFFSVLQCVAVRCSALQCVAVCCTLSLCVSRATPERYGVGCSVLQCVAVYCSVLQSMCFCPLSSRCQARPNKISPLQSFSSLSPLNHSRSRLSVSLTHPHIINGLYLTYK